MRVTYIQPVFDRRVQHGEVGEEDTQVGHGALGVGLCNRKKIKIVSSVPPRGFYSQPTQRGISEQPPAAIFQTVAMARDSSHTHTHAHTRQTLCSNSPLRAGRSPLQPSIKPAETPPAWQKWHPCRCLNAAFCGRTVLSSAFILKSIIKLSNMELIIYYN